MLRSRKIRRVILHDTAWGALPSPFSLVRTQKFFEKGKAPPTLKNNRELGLFFMEGQLLCDQRSNGGFAGCQLLDIATQRKPTQIFSTIFIASR